MFVSLPYITVAVRAEPHDTIFVGNPQAVKRVCTHHEEEVENLNKTEKEVKRMMQ